MFSKQVLPMIGYCHNEKCLDFNKPVKVGLKSSDDLDIVCYCVSCENTLKVNKIIISKKRIVRLKLRKT